MARTRQSEWRPWNRYHLVTEEQTPRARVEEVVDEYWVFGPQIVSDDMRAGVWTVEAYAGFDEAMDEEGPDWLKALLLEENIGPCWHRTVYTGGGACG